MSERLDVRRMLLRRGWTQDPELWPILRKNGALWASVNNCGDSGLDGVGRKYSIAFDSDVPARVIVAACEEAAKATRGAHGPVTPSTPSTPGAEGVRGDQRGSGGPRVNQGEALELLGEALRKRAENGGRHIHHRDCIHNLPPEEQVAVRGRTVEWWTKVIGPMPEQITPDQWETDPPAARKTFGGDR